MRLCRVPACTTYGDLEAVGGRHDRSWASRNRARWQRRPVMQCVDLSARKSLEQPVVDHRLGACPPLFGGLEDQMNATIEIARLRQVSSCTEQHGRMAVVTAAMSDARM